MDPQTIRITIELPQGAEVQGPGASGDATKRPETSTPSDAIDGGSPPAALVETLGDPEVPSASPATVDATDRVASGDAIDAGSFPDRLASEMEAEGPRHPFGHPDIGILAMGTSTVLDRRN